MLAFLNAPLRRVPTWAVYMGGLAPAAWLFYAAFTGGLGFDPLAALEHETGLWALRFLIAALVVTPLLRMTRLNLVKFRRAFGLIAFAYVVLHLGVWLWLDHAFNWQAIFAEIIKRPYITIGMAAFLILVPLAVTSNDLSLRKLGAKVWRKIHWWAYPATFLGAIHFLLVVKAWPPEPLIYTGIVTALLGWRAWQKFKTRVPAATTPRSGQAA